MYHILSRSCPSVHPRISKYTASWASHPLRSSRSPSKVLASRILGFRTPHDSPVPSSSFSTSFCLDVMIVFLLVSTGVSSSELWGAESVFGDTGLALEECCTASARALSNAETSISPSVRSGSGGSL